jgi:hypothetical protein
MVVGQLVNRCRFHLRQDVFFGFSGFTSAPGDLLSRVCRTIHPPRDRDALQDALRGRLSQEESYLGSEARVEWLRGEEADCRDRLAGREMGGLPEIRRAILDGYFRHWPDDLRGMIVEPVDESYRSAFRFGEVLDQGLCPADVWRHLDDPQPDPPILPSWGRLLSISDYAKEARPRAALIPKRPVPLARRRRAPGDVSPDDSWWDDVVDLWHEVGLQGAPPVEPDAEDATAWLRRHVAGVARAALAGLRGIDASLRALPAGGAADRTPCSGKGTAPRLSFHNDTYSVDLDGRRYEVTDPIPFHILNALADAPPPGLTQTDLQKLPGLRGKNIRRELAKLPPALSALIRSAPGRGRWLQLPDSQDCP